MVALSPPRPSSSGYRHLSHAGLPIYRSDAGAFSAFYAPGYVAVIPQAQAGDLEISLAASAGTGVDPVQLVATELVRRARSAVERFDALQEERYQPECLTLYLNNECNLRCSYCYASPRPGPGRRLELDVIKAAARLVAGNCRDKGRPFYAVFHGGGEPSLDFDLLRRAVGRVQATAQEFEIPTFLYIATNGVMSREHALWLAGHFDLVGLSCDGPAAIHDRQRPQCDGTGSLSGLEKTARILRDEGCRLHVRTTVTPETMQRQAEIADYVCRYLEPEEIHVEPVYAGGRSSAGAGWEPDMAGAYVRHFLEGRSVASSHGIPMMSSGSRPGTIHGPYCHVFRQVLNLVPGGAATACFKLCDAGQVRAKEAQTGRFDPETGAFELQPHLVEALRRRLAPRPPACAGCVNRYHCAGDCPDRCPLDRSSEGEEIDGPGFRCQVQKAMTSALLHEMAQRLWSGPGGPCGMAIV